VAVSEIAAFDLDGTLTRRDCLMPFFLRVAGRGRLAGAMVRHSPVLWAAMRDRERRDEAKATMVRALLTGRSAADMEEEGERFADHVSARWVRADVADRLAWHVAAGHEVALVSASLAVYAEPLGRRLGATRVIATELEVGGDGRLTGRLAGPNCRGDEKVRRLAVQYGELPALVWAYGDSPDDRPMLSRAANPVWVGRELLQAAPA